MRYQRSGSEEFGEVVHVEAEEDLSEETLNALATGARSTVIKFSGNARCVAKSSVALAEKGDVLHCVV